MTQAFDHATMGEAFSKAGMDPRQWCSYGIVDADSADNHSVRFNDENGNALPEGVLVSVTLQPSGISVPARVAMRHAGSGEGSFSPIGPGDEVLCLIPEGNERAGVAIIAKMSNAKDTFPTTVAGQDVTQNNVVFDRHVCPYILESASSILFRVGKTGQQLAMDATGNVFLSDSDGNLLALTADALSLQLADGSALVQVIPGAKRVGIQADTTSFLFDAAKSVFQTPGTLSIGTSGLGATGHAVTLEQVINLILNFTLLVLVGPTGSTTVKGETVGPGKLFDSTTAPANPVLLTAIQSWLQASVLPSPFTPPAGGGDYTAMGLAALIGATLLTQLPDPAGLAPIPTFYPGIAKQGLMF